MLPTSFPEHAAEVTAAIQETCDIFERIVESRSSVEARYALPPGTLG